MLCFGGAKRPAAALLVGASVFFPSFVCFAKDSPAKEAPEVVVTANRYARSLDQVQADVSVVTEEEIRRSGATNLVDVLKRLPGINYSSNGGGQQTSTLFIRGSESKHTLFLIDGQRIGPLDGFSQFQFQHVPLDQIERIEVLRGPGSSLYGSDAIGGVVQIITKKAQTTGGSVTAGVGTNHTRKYGASASLVQSDFKARFGVGHEYSDGINANRDNSGSDPYRISSGSLNVEFNAGPSTKLNASAMVNDVNNEFDPNPQFNRDTQTLLNASLNHQWGEGRSTDIRVGSAVEKLVFPGFQFGTTTTQNQIAVDNRVPLAGGTLLAALEFLDQKFFQKTNFPPPATAPNITDTSVYSGVVSYTFDALGLDWQANLRHDLNSNFKDVTTGQLSGSKTWEGFTIGASYGNGFKRPTFTQISGFVNTFATGFAGVNPGILNTNLEPETSDNFEAYIQWPMLWGQSRVSLFANDVESLITGRTISAGNTRFENQPGTSKIRGVTWAHSAQFNDLQVDASVDLLSAKDSNDQRLVRRPTRAFKMNAAYPVTEKLSVSGELVSQSRRDDLTGFPSTRVTLGGYTLMNAAVVYACTPASQITLRLDNLTGKDYEIVRGFGVARQDAMLTYQHQF